MPSRLLNNLLLYLVMAVTLASGLSCRKDETRPVSWQDIAFTIPSDPKFIVSLNTEFIKTGVLKDVWGNRDVSSLIARALALDSVMPSHLVVVGMPKSVVVTWPLSNPERVNGLIEKWSTASLNNTVDAHMCAEGSASLVISATQAWVVNNVHGENFVNELLSAALNTKAAYVRPLSQAITTVPKEVAAVVPYSERYYAIQLNHDMGQVRVDVDAYDGSGKRKDVVTGLGRLPEEYIDLVSDISPFAAVQIDNGTMPELLMRLATLTDKTELKVTTKFLEPLVKDVSGSVVARWNEYEFEVDLPYVNESAALAAEKKISGILSKFNMEFFVRKHKNILKIRTPFTYQLPPIGIERSTPHRHSETDNPSAIAFARVDLSESNVAEIYFELAPTHGRLQVDFKEDGENLQRVMNLVKEIVFHVL